MSKQFTLDIPITEQVVVDVIEGEPKTPPADFNISVGIPMWGVWGYGDTIAEAVENMVFIDPLGPTDEEKRYAAIIYAGVKAACPELAPADDPAWAA